MLRRKYTGFTLLEILIALFIFTLISIILATSVHTLLNTQAETEKRAAHITELQIALLILSRDIEQAIDRPVFNAKSIEEPAFLGSDTQMTLTHTGFANPLGSLQQSTLQRTQYYFNTRGQLIRRAWPVLDQQPASRSSERVLLSGISSLYFMYLDAHGQFQKSWPPPSQKKSELPRAVRLLITLQDGSKLSQLYIISGTSLHEQEPV